MRRIMMLLLATGIILANTVILGCQESKPAPGTPTPFVPTYSQVIKTYPKDIKICTTELNVSVNPDGTLNCQGTLEERNGERLFQYYGAKLTFKTDVTLDGKKYPVGTKLTVDKNLNWLEVKSWD